MNLLFLNYIAINGEINRDKCKGVIINTELQFEYRIILEHIIEFVKRYSEVGNYRHSIMLRETKIIEPIEIHKHPDELWNIKEKDIKLCEQIKENPDLFFEKKTIISGKKNRNIVKYRDDEEGVKARNLHEKLDAQLRKKYNPNNFSFAYHKDRRAKDAVELHLSSKGFIKIDIKKFFENIDINRLENKLMIMYDIDKNYKTRIHKIIGSCYCEGRLPLGLCCSPIFSDVYLREFDEKVFRYCNENKLVYTRYADDIMISKETGFNEEEQSEVLNYVKKCLEDEQLVLNDNKTTSVNFGEKYRFVRYIGINIVYRESGNYLSVGKRYIYDLAKDLLEYNKQTLSSDQAVEKNLEQFYLRKEIIGKIGYIRQVEGKRGVKRLYNRISKYMPNMDLEQL